jgi:hypothetical protein
MAMMGRDLAERLAKVLGIDRARRIVLDIPLNGPVVAYVERYPDGPAQAVADVLAEGLDGATEVVGVDRPIIVGNGDGARVEIR